MKKFVLSLFSVLLVFSMMIGSFAACSNKDEEKEIKYNQACTLVDEGKYEEAYAMFEELGNYKDSQKYLSRFVYFPTVLTYTLSDRTGVMNVDFGAYNLPSRMVSDGSIGTKDGMYIYDNQGNLVRQAVNFNEDFATFDYTYDANNNMIKAEYSEEGELVTVQDYTYNAAGSLTKEVYTRDGVVIYVAEWFYDENGKLNRNDYSNTENGYSDTITYTYNADGKVTNESGVDFEGNTYTTTFSYGADGRLAQEVYVEGDFQCTVYYTYDNAGNCIKEETVYLDGTKDIFTREYDTNGNTTKEMLTEADGTVQTVESQYVLTYLMIDVPASTMNQLMGLFNVSQYF